MYVNFQFSRFNFLQPLTGIYDGQDKEYDETSRKRTLQTFLNRGKHIRMFRELKKIEHECERVTNCN